MTALFSPGVTMGLLGKTVGIPQPDRKDFIPQYQGILGIETSVGDQEVKIVLQLQAYSQVFCAYPCTEPEEKPFVQYGLILENIIGGILNPVFPLQAITKVGAQEETRADLLADYREIVLKRQLQGSMGKPVCLQIGFVAEIRVEQSRSEGGPFLERQPESDPEIGAQREFIASIPEIFINPVKFV